jgi:hypothetical protein
MTSIESQSDHAPLAPPLAKTELTTLQLWAQNNVYGSDSSLQPTPGTSKPAVTDSGRTPETIIGSGLDNKPDAANPDVRRILGDFNIDGIHLPDAATIARTGAFLGDLQLQAYASPEAAIVTVANKLASDPNLTQLVTDGKGFITQKSIDGVRMADEGSLVLEKGAKHPVARVLTAKERANLDYVASHNRVIGPDGIAAGALAVAKDSRLAQLVAEKQVSSPGQFGKLASDLIRAALAANAGPKPSDKVNEAAHKTAVEAGKPHVRTTSEPILDQDHFAEAAKRVLAKIDTAHTGEVTKAQLEKALQDPSFTGQDAQALAAMYQNFDRLHNLSGHEHFYSTASITPGDLDKFQSVEKDRGQLRLDTANMKQWAHTDLTQFTQNGSDHLTKDDVDRALKDPKTPDYDRQMLQIVQKHFGEMDSWYSSGLTVKDFDDLDNKAMKDDMGQLVSGVWASCYMVSNYAQEAGTSYDLYASKDPLKSITPDAVKQGSIGDCYYEAVVASLAKSNPALIRDSIKDNHDGTYTVTFPGAKDEPITVKAPTEAELGLYNHGSKNGVWAAVFEKAYGQYSINHSLFNSNTPQEGADGGGTSGPVIKLLTGSDSSFSTTTFNSQAAMAEKLEAAFSSHPPKAVVSGISKELWRWVTFRDQNNTSDQFYRDHVYSVTGFKPDGHGGGTVVVRNPWGRTDGTPDGTIEIPLAEFMKNFSDVTIQD